MPSILFNMYIARESIIREMNTPQKGVNLQRSTAGLNADDLW